MNTTQITLFQANMRRKNAPYEMWGRDKRRAMSKEAWLVAPGDRTQQRCEYVLAVAVVLRVASFTLVLHPEIGLRRIVRNACPHLATSTSVYRGERKIITYQVCVLDVCRQKKKRNRESREWRPVK